MNQYPYQFGRPPGQQAHIAYPYQQAQFHQGNYGAVPSGPSSVPQNAAITQDSFDYNRNAIPGLTFGATDPTAAWQPWPPPPPVGNPPIHAAYLAQGNQPAQVFSHSPKVQQPSERVYVPPHAEAARDNTVEEGELSEGIFEDLYEPEAPPEQDRAHSVIAYQGRTADSVRPTPDVALRVPADQVSFEAKTQPPYLEDHDRSRSYSPYLSPRELRSRNEMTSQVGDTQDQRQDEATLPRTNGDHPVASNSESKPLPTQTPSTLAEVKTKAKEAILRLWALDVRFENYIDEGIDEKVVRSLFTDLDLEIPVKPRIQRPPAVDTTQHRASDPPSTAASSLPPPQPLATNPVRKPTEMEKSEERKDRIARKLAAKAGKPSPSALTVLPAGPNGNPAPSASTQTPTSQSTSGASTEQVRKRAEKDRILQEKMEALKKSRELRAQKAAEKAEARKSSPEASEPSEQLAEPNAVQEQQTPNEADQQGPPIPGLFLSTPQSTVTINPRKRPVASDLIDYPPTSHKRPFGHNRADTSLVINVSDDSDSEDIEMEMSSPQEGPQTTRHTAVSPLKKTTSFRSFPPLSEKRGSFQNPVPAPQSTTPPAGSKGSANPGELDRMHRSIDEMKRKIAEAEERRRSKAKKPIPLPAGPNSNGPSVSEAGDSGTAPHPLRRAQSASALGLGVSSPDPAPRSEQKILPKAIASNRERRMRIASDSLPALEATLRAKTTKLRLLKSEVARLEREVARDLTEKTRLTNEMEGVQSDDSGTSGTDDSNGKQGDNQVSQPSEGSESHAPTLRLSPDTEAVHPVLQAEDAPLGMLGSPSTAPDSVVGRPISKGEADADNNQLLPLPPASQDEVMRSSPELDDEAAPTIEGTSPSDAPTDPASTQETSKPASHIDSDVPADQDSDHTPLGEMRLDDAETDQSPDASPHLESGGPLESDANAQDMAKISSGLTETLEEGLGMDGEASRASEPPYSVFVPYESILKNFLSYRFHPKYNQEVGGGLRSLTYSNKIDPKLALCPEELADQKCRKGADCEFQHLDSLAADDSEILLQLGNSDRLEGEPKQQYNNGLRELLADLRSRNLKDFKEISEAVIAYRTRFFGDKSRILPLGDFGI